MARFQDLPVELIVAIMNCVDRPEDIFAMIHADPWILHCFLDNRKQVVEPYLNNLLEVCGGHVSTAYLLAGRLRHAKQDPGFDIHKPHHRERMLSPILRSYISGPDTQRPLSHRASLATICALSTLSIDVGWITTSYISQARAQILRYRRRSEDFPDVSPKEHQMFINAACRFEGYVQAFFYIEEPLFPRDESIRRLLFAPCLHGSYDFIRANNTFYSIAYYIYDQHCTMMQNIMNSLRVSETCLVSGRTQDRQKRRLQNCKQIEVNKAWRLKISHGLCYRTFESILDSRYPNVLMVHGIELYKIGTVEKHSWNPWVDSDVVFEIMPDQWKWADSFWDADRTFRLF
ncbi:hypothetical protein RAB80_012721 [Fusarium oxysporum f. sp. vasinfectum]|uniref:Uncharacterized protein n=1 Tax=Fusarium oxysporum f. sp. vasinfectum 25433 TaxID=1089449 RepID=X0N0K3_FUSOX|nr:hypothetical protein FOTG_07180 [Fusarium oxysporum f. sp. vasinfectum 25433]KAK2672642.1 hypothetical protein RAB80_012721 [Fusarium oxysporum f. sp. vasinfectum]KAK2928091.1 hypothetical protein FoTM2_010953 [Fusarium oxysporum f. sp. vasinfectum]